MVKVFIAVVLAVGAIAACSLYFTDSAPRSGSPETSEWGDDSHDGPIDAGIHDG
jgi:hypothetical protein